MALSHIPISVFLPEEGESWSAFVRRALAVKGELLLVVAHRDRELEEQPEARTLLIEACQPHRHRLRLATKLPQLIAEARAKGIRVVERTRALKQLLKGHERESEVLRAFSPHQWKQQLKSKLQRMGLLSVPKIRIYTLVGLSLILFSFVTFRLLPSAELRIWPRQEPVSQTVNVYLVESGASVKIPSRVRTMPLVPLTVSLQHTLDSEHITKKFIGSTARMELTIANMTTEEYAFRLGTRFVNEAGMIFRSTAPVTIGPRSQKKLQAVADALDLYGQVIGERGNVPAGLSWKIPGLPEAEQKQVFARNLKSGTGGTSAYRTILTQDNIDIAKVRLEKELLAKAMEFVEAQRRIRNAKSTNQVFELLSPTRYPELTHATYSGFILPTNLLGTEVSSFSVSGGIHFTAFAYDAQAILEFLRRELESHVRQGKYLVEATLGLDRLVVHVIDYDDNLAWIKLTVDLSATEEFILDPLSPDGALFAKRVRERIAGMSVTDAQRIIRNMPEIENVEISVWPPWNDVLPAIPSHISVLPQ